MRKYTPFGYQENGYFAEKIDKKKQNKKGDGHPSSDMPNSSRIRQSE